ncbi:MAG: protein-export chaperone SecB [Gammaproteobacteria bacterium]|jgi:preprotein translocase subunit SecB|nr:protein-export chaperone SecB [Gammaproteobacteria bacterium]MBT3488155.1 protein-export chaperone SecB [Gammaproteobacteria bacterium]MBT3718451.1 protein-export chaperone SecB [Gammaproteobacteria bacterium]MBT3844126.1 protein-export chaperone SecB [Gammaproteobacteria bacterium]MBT3892243.1 protein-export chaperone SecB [Gammaproteobacteria bacterium]
MSDENNSETPSQTFDIQKIYLKDVSYESPQSPAIFQEKWEPETNLQIGTQHTKIGENVFEVVLSLTTTITVNNETAFLVEVQQAGIFTVSGFEEGAMGQLLGAYAPNILFPYAREAVSDLTTKGGFPPLLLAPINFDALYAQNLQKQAQSDDATSTETQH